MPGNTTYQQIPAVLSRLTALKALRIYFNNEWRNRISRDLEETLSIFSRGDHSTIVGTLSPAHSTLEVLQFGVSLGYSHDTRAYLDWVQPADTFTSFKCLRLLVISQEGLVGTASNTMKHPTALLPQSLEALRIFYPRYSLYDWIELIAPCREQLPNLRLLQLYIFNGRGDLFEKLRYTNSYYRTKKALGSIGTQFRLGCSTDIAREEWKDENYDPCTSDLVEFLESLDVQA
ncbi:hypothetical protein BDV96DRAFT_647675 [Lophiotrema nucula]|uniref:F-box domain-containing protein n=1 Tax=Lophiotrema nucula TaxID=690887 RepID=A0A6A5Z3Z7_9PLEO|nr:hypothetical protein BDV96DRAFT_647675 [Lophiotrema nucula]